MNAPYKKPYTPKSNYAASRPAQVIDWAKLSSDFVSAGLSGEAASKCATYLKAAIKAESNKEQDKKPVSSNTQENLLALAVKYNNLGLVLDGINVVVTGWSMAMVTYHGYKNKVLSVYPEAKIDIQLVREGDDFKVDKKDGKVHYTHSINDPFGDKAIIGAYAVFKTKRGEFLETLNASDYKSMKDASKMKPLWEKWASEFWLKSVMKRACKRHFDDIVAEIEKVDNEDFGARDDGSPAVPEKEAFDMSALKKQIDELKTPKEYKDLVKTIPKNLNEAEKEGLRGWLMEALERVNPPKTLPPAAEVGQAGESKGTEAIGSASASGESGPAGQSI